MAYGRLKTDMHGNTSRWGHREDIKRAADRLRRHFDLDEVEDGVDEFMRLREERKRDCCSPVSGAGHEPDCGM